MCVYIYIYFFFYVLVALGLHDCAWPFSRCSEWGLVFAVECGLLWCCWLLSLQSIGCRCMAPRACGPWALVALWHVESSWTRDQTHVPCLDRQILIHQRSPGFLVLITASRWWWWWRSQKTIPRLVPLLGTLRPASKHCPHLQTKKQYKWKLFLQKNLLIDVYCSFIHNFWNLDTIMMSFNRWTDK